LADLGIASAADVAAIRADVEREIEAAIDFAKASPAPSVADLMKYVYAA
jgi:pyruvate dehydrogenase E1 component alpha subunit